MTLLDVPTPQSPTHHLPEFPHVGHCCLSEMKKVLGGIASGQSGQATGQAVSQIRYGRVVIVFTY